MVSAIIPALNEEKRIYGVISALKKSSLVNQIIVVDDGSNDKTGEISLKEGVELIRLSQNKGKSFALDVGVKKAKYDILLFLDADLEGLKTEDIQKILEPVLLGKRGMYIGITEKKQWWINRIIRFLPLISGQRALLRKVWESVPQKYKEGFQIEVALNYFCRKNGWQLGFTLLSGVKNAIKEKKYGLWTGLWKRILMSLELGIIFFKLSVFRGKNLRK